MRGEGGGGGLSSPFSIPPPFPPWAPESACLPCLRARGGGVGGLGYVPQNDPHDVLIILNIHKWGRPGCLLDLLFHWRPDS